MRRTALALLGLCLILSGRALAQSAEGISIISYDTTNQQIDTFSATDLDYTASLYYSPYVEGYLYQSDDWNDPIKSGSAKGNFGCGSPNDTSMSSCAWGNMSAPAVSGDDYGLESDHYVETSWTTGQYDSSGNPTYYDYYGYYANDNYTEGGSGDGYDPPGYTLVVNVALIYLGSTEVEISTYDQTPIITSVTPDIIPDGTTTQVVVAGQNFGATPQLQFPDAPGMTISYSSRSATQITAQITPNGNEGTHSVQVVSNGVGGAGFLTSAGTSSSSSPQTLTVSGNQNQCTWQIKTGQNLYHIASSVQYGSSNYQSASIPIAATTTQNAVCPSASQVTWTVHAEYKASGAKRSQGVNLSGFTTSLNGTETYATQPGQGGQLTFTAKFTINNGSKTLTSSKTVYVDGTAIPTAQVKSQLVQDYSPPSGGTQNLFLGVACNESKFKQFSTTTLKADGATSIPLVLYGMNACWPNESFGGGAHIGITMVKTNMVDAYDWMQNSADGPGPLYFGWALGQARAYVKSAQITYPKLPAPSSSQLEDMALIYYRWGAQSRGNTYWIPNPTGTAWVKNPNADYTAYTKSVRDNLKDPSCQ